MVPRHRIVYRGDTKQCLIYLPFARNLLSMAARTKGSVLRRRFNLSDWCRVHYKPNGISTIYIEAAPPFGYMESGFLDWRLLIYGAEDTYKPSIIRFNNFVASNSGLPKDGLYINASESRPVIDGDLSWALGCKSQSQEVTVSTLLGDTKVFRSETPIYCMGGDKLLEQKTAHANCPPSLFTGRMRKYIQAVFGSRRDDYEGGWSVAGGFLSFNTGEFMTDTNGELLKDIFGDPIPDNIYLYPYSFTGYSIVNVNGSYVFVEIINNNIYARKMLVEYKPADKLDTGDLRDVDILEFYELATLKFDTTKYHIGPIVEMPTDIGPKAYGWHFDSTGTKATVCLSKDVPINGLNYLGEPRTRTGWRCYKADIELTIGFDDDGGIIGDYALSISAGVDFFPRGQHSLYYPFVIVNDRMLLAYTGDADAYINSGDAPLYSYYDENDTVQVVQANNSLWSDQPTYFDSTLDSGNPTVVFGITCWGADPTIRSDLYSRSIGSEYLNANMSIGSDTYTGRSELYTLFQWREYHLGGSLITTGFGDGREKCGAPIGGPIESHTYEYFSKIGESYRRTLTKNDHTRSDRPFMIIPFNDANSVIIGRSTSILGTNETSNFENMTANVLKKLDNDWAKVTGMTFAAPSPEVTLPEFNDELEDFLNHQKGEMFLYTPKGKQMIDDFFYDGTLSASDEPIYVLANPQNTVAEPWYGHRVTVVTSYNGASWWSFEGGGVKGSNQWPTGMAVVGSPVGWA